MEAIQTRNAAGHHGMRKFGSKSILHAHYLVQC